MKLSLFLKIYSKQRTLNIIQISTYKLAGIHNVHVIPDLFSINIKQLKKVIEEKPKHGIKKCIKMLYKQMQQIICGDFAGLI